jgi:DNA polymerase III delta prime subunit
LIRFKTELHQPDQYFTVFVSLLEEIEITRFRPEDLYFILINKLIRELYAEEIGFDEAEFAEIAEDWVKERNVAEEIKEKSGLETGAGVEAGFSFWKIFSAKGFLKTFYGYDNTTTETIRKSINRNPDKLVQRLNTALAGVRQEIAKANKGKDILFIIDDFEKTRPDVYNQVFLQDPKFILEMRAHLICCVPIQTFYNIQNQPAADLFRVSYLPMVRLEKDNGQFVKIITHRVDPMLFKPGILPQIVQLSGGSPRQLLRIVNQCLLDTDTKVSQEILDETSRRLAVERLRPLSNKHREILRKKNFDDVSPELLELLYTMNVVEYNGDDIIRKINPLLESDFNE